MTAVLEAPITNPLGDIYPTDWTSYIGQEKAKKQIRKAILSAKMLGEITPHILIASGMPGVGKTALSNLAAKEIGSTMKMVSGPIDRDQARIMFSDMEDGDVLFWDEFHLAVLGGKAKAEWLLNYMQDGVLLGPMGPDPLTPKVTIIAATTEAGKLPQTIIDRFGCTPIIVPYSDDDATSVALSMVPKVFGALEWPAHGACSKIALAANNNPRVIRKILVELRNEALVSDAANYDHDIEDYDIDSTLEELEITEDGLDRTMQRYLVAFLTRFPGKAGEKSLTDALQEPGGLQHVESVLFAKEYVIIDGSRGRVLSGNGARRAQELRRAGVVV